MIIRLGTYFICFLILLLFSMSPIMGYSIYFDVLNVELLSSIVIVSVFNMHFYIQLPTIVPQ